MGFRFRKSFKAGPFRFTASKSGISTSVGVKGARVTRTANGKTRTTVGIPGTGISYTSTTGGKRRTSSGGVNIGRCFAWIATAFFALCVIAYFPHLTSWLMMILVALSCPIAAWQDKLGLLIKKPLKIAIIIILFLAAVMLAPADSAEGTAQGPAESVVFVDAANSLQS